MPLVDLGRGLTLDIPWVGAKPRLVKGLNMRSRLGQVETHGLFGPLKNTAGEQIRIVSSDPIRSILITPSTSVGQVIVGSANSVWVLDYDPASTPASGTRWRSSDVTPVGLPPAVDVVPNPSAGRVEIPPVWQFLDQDDVVVCIRANTAGTDVYTWDRDRTNNLSPLSNAPKGAVGGGISNRILVLLGCDSFTAPDPARSMTVRWSDRFNFDDWTPTDLNLSGEFQLDGGSRIVGGGMTGFGICVWTDRRLALVTETFDINSVFTRKYIAGSGGMMANLAWCEAGGAVYYYDESRTLRVFDGGSPRTIPNPIRLGTIERLDDRQMSRAYMVANPEFQEVLLWYPSGDSDDPNVCLVYNYADDAWHVWGHDRTAYSGRFGVIRALGVNSEGYFFQHDLDVSLPEPWLLGVDGGGQASIPVADVTPFDAYWETNLITLESPTKETWQGVSVAVDHLPSPADGAEGDTFSVSLGGYREATATGDFQETVEVFEQGQAEADFRTSGKAIRMKCTMTGIKTVFRFGSVDIDGSPRGRR